MEKQRLILFKNAGSSTILYLNCFELPNLVYFGRGAARNGLFRSHCLINDGHWGVKMYIVPKF